MKNHKFIFDQGQWLGEGKISLSMTDENLPFFTRWKIPEKDESGRVGCVQEIQVAGLPDIMLNEFLFSNIEEGKFQIELENQSLGKVIGKGVIADGTIGWEFRMSDLGFEGFEFYEKIGPEEYKMHAEYATNDEFRTVIHGRVWKSAN